MPNVPEGSRKIKIDKTTLGLATGQSPWLEHSQGGARAPRHITTDLREDGLRQAVGCQDEGHELRAVCPIWYSQAMDDYLNVNVKCVQK